MLVAIKYAGDSALVWLGTGRLWTPVGYLNSATSLVADFQTAPAWLMPAALLWMLPFLWAGITLTLRRAMDADWSPWWSLCFFVPYLSYALMLALCLAPSRAPGQRSPSRLSEKVKARGRWLGIAAGVVLGLVMVESLRVFAQYGVSLFLGTPFVMGAITGFIYNCCYPTSDWETAKVTVMMFVAAAASVLFVGVEGLICILMASPLVLGLGLLGGRLGRVIALQLGRRQMPPAFLALLVLPASTALEPAHSTGRVSHEVRTSVEIAAAPERVWRHVIGFSPIQSPPGLLFRLGIAEPRSARIAGAGVGAIRLCEFSTGAFVEPITVWEPGRRLAFDVASSPPPLVELTPYSHLSPLHLRGYLRSRKGEFRLVSLAGGRTRLEGSTWYEIEMAPEGYWQVVSDYLIHAIHRRVLEHIREEAESGNRVIG